MAIEVITMHPPTALALAAEKPTLGISVNILAKNCSKNLKECLESLKDFVRPDQGDEIVVVDTGSIDETPTVAEEWGARVFKHPELSSSDFLNTLKETFPTEYEENKDAPFLREGLMVDFAKARNLAMEHSKNDLIFWIDSDDVLKGAKELRDFCLQFFEVPGNKIFHMPYDYHFDDDGYVTCILWRERAFRKNLYTWRGVCHECVVPLKQSDIQLNRMPGETARILHKNFSGHKAADIRNYLIMKTAYEKAEWKDPRLEIYLGNACRGLERWRESIHWYTLGMMRSGSKDDRYHCAVNIATTYTVLARPWRALDFFFQAVKINPLDPRAYYGIARSFYDLKKWNECLVYTGIAREMGQPRTLLAVDPGSLDYFPMFFEAQCLKELKRPGAALGVVEQIMALRPNCKESRLIYDEITNWAREEKIKETIGPLGLLAFSDQGYLEIIQRIRPEIRRKYRDLQMEQECHDEKAVAFLCPGDANGHWDGTSFDHGIGGSEKMVIQIARGLAKRGWAVDVYANPKEENCYKKIDGVWWRPFQSYNPLLRRDCAVLWRSPNLLEYVKRARKILVDLHDVPDFADMSSPEYDRIDGFVWKSKYHRELANGCPESKCVYGRNGISPELFTQEVKRNFKKIIWTSSGDRGLRIALAAWDLVREHIPDAEFHVFYGFTDFYHKVASQKEYSFMGDCGCERHMMDYLEECMTMIDALGVNYHGMLPSKELARHILEAGVWLYPTRFPEISPVHGDTLIETPVGQLKIKDLVGQKDFYVYSCDASGDLSLSKVGGVFLTRKQARVVRVRFKPGIGRGAKKIKELILTPDHEVMLLDGSYKPAGELRSGDRVKAFHRQINSFGPGRDLIGVTQREAVCEYRFVASKMAGRDLQPNEVVDHLDSDTRNNDPSNLAIHATHGDHMKDHWDRLSEEERSARSKSRTADLLRWHGSMTKEQLSEVKRAAVNSRWQKKLSNHSVVSVEDFGTADVYCMAVDPDHNFVANGIFVHNCINAMEAQAGGAMPVCSDYAALKETVKNGVIVNPLDYRDIASKVISVIKAGEQHDDYRKSMMAEAAKEFDIEGAVDIWERELLK